MHALPWLLVAALAGCGAGPRAERREAHERRERGRAGAAARAGTPCPDERADDLVTASARDDAHGERAARGWVDAGGDPACRALAVARAYVDVDPARALRWAEEALDGDPRSRDAALVGAVAAARARNAPRAAQLLVTAESLSPPEQRGAASIEVSRALGRAGLHADALTAARQAVSIARADLRPRALERLIAAARAAGRHADADRAWQAYAATLADDAARAAADERIRQD